LKENVRKLREVMESVDTVMLTTVDEKYHLVSRPTAVRVADFDGVIRLFAPGDARCVAHNHRARVGERLARFADRVGFVGRTGHSVRRPRLPRPLLA